MTQKPRRRRSQRKENDLGFTQGYVPNQPQEQIPQEEYPPKGYTQPQQPYQQYPQNPSQYNTYGPNMQGQMFQQNSPKTGSYQQESPFGMQPQNVQTTEKPLKRKIDWYALGLRLEKAGDRLQGKGENIKRTGVRIKGILSLILIVVLAVAFLQLGGNSKGQSTVDTRKALTMQERTEEILNLYTKKHGFNVESWRTDQDGKLSLWLIKTSSPWDEDHLVLKSCEYATETMRHIFEEVPDVATFFIRFKGTSYDQKGNESTTKYMDFNINREQAKGIDYEKFAKMVSLDYNYLLNISDTIIYPAVKNYLKNLK